jgi:hypothetical protein
VQPALKSVKDAKAVSPRQLSRRYVANEPHCWGNVDRANRK